MDATYIEPGQRGYARMPYSEVNMAMKIAGEFRDFELTNTRHPMAQILDSTGGLWSFPITHGEAGIMRDHLGRYYYYRDFATPRTYAGDWSNVA